MSEASGAPNGDSELFNMREQKLILAAMGSLKSGPPDIDMDTFMKLGGFNTKKTAQNQWGALKKKLAANNPDGEEGAAAKTPKTPSKTPSKKRTKKDADDEDGADGGEGTSSKKAKTPGKKNALDGDGSPTKKAPAKPRKKSVAVKGEENGTEEAPVKSEVAADGEEDAPGEEE
ncbi:hypothetical protein CKM354_001095500 [Cercospora kikuchii]|uniref:Uncharacterized protein n=1 Tax=Cercospora kikuchii TaxID=84275 RepID=A0A9P3CS92_9PEZI|nr:uncharacterized protein CKM354_001095500 [Cercospora kikuchii]GIZ47876.1 hypothetical protein CKM354_001095500 [Cercospora kikuchii]